MGRANGRDLAAGAVLIAIGLFFALSGQRLRLGTAGEMGPGYLPLVLAGLLGLLGVIVILGSFGRPREAAAPLPWRGIVTVGVALLLFGLAVQPLGLGPALAVAVFLGAAGSQRFSVPVALALTAGMVLFAWAVFIRGLGVPIRMLGPWFS